MAEAKAKADPDGYLGHVSYDMVRVTTEAHYSEALFRPLGPHGRTLFYKHELIRLVGQRCDVCFAVPYLADPTSKRVAPQYIMLRQFRELNPAERAYLGLPLFGGWDLVTRHGIEGAKKAACRGAAKMAAKGDAWGADRCVKGIDLFPDKDSDPRNFTVGEMLIRGLDGLPAATRELHPWPVVYRVAARLVGEPDTAWATVKRLGKPMAAITAAELRALMPELHHVEMTDRQAAQRADRAWRQTEWRTTASVTLPTPYEPIQNPV